MKHPTRTKLFQRLPALLALAVPLAIPLGGACSGAVGEPRMASESVGELISPEIVRTSPLAQVAETCGSPGVADLSLDRHPYIQNVNDSSARLLWTSTGDREQVEIWEPGSDPRVVPANDDSTRFLKDATQRSARFEGLEPSTIHCYRVVRDDGTVVYGPSGFRTAPAKDDTRPVDIIAFGDSGTLSDGQLAVRDQMATVPADLMIHTGDVAYADGTLNQFEREVFDVYQGLFDVIPFFPSIGNHDDRTASAGPYREIFDLPTNGGSAEDQERRYSFDYGMVHFVALDTQRFDDEHAEWLDRDLAATDKPWKIVYGHHPPYSSGDHGSAVSFRESIAPVLEKHGVQLVLSGHDHHYERSNDINGVTYVVTGAGGATPRTTKQGDFSKYVSETMHFLSLHAEEDELRGYAVDATGEVFDSFRLAH